MLHNIYIYHALTGLEDSAECLPPQAGAKRGVVPACFLALEPLQIGQVCQCQSTCKARDSKSQAVFLASASFLVESRTNMSCHEIAVSRYRYYLASAAVGDGLRLITRTVCSLEAHQVSDSSPTKDLVTGSSQLPCRAGGGLPGFELQGSKL